MDSGKDPGNDLIAEWIDALKIPLNADDAVLKKILSDLRKKTNRERYSAILIFDQFGSNYEQIQSEIEFSQLYNVYYLDSGINGYEAYLQKMAAMQIHEKGKKIGQKKCQTCP